jgi:hypothetical protein
LNQEQKLLKGMESTVNDIYLNIAARQLWIRKTGFDSTAEQTNKMAHEIMLKNTWMIPRIGFETIFQLIQLSVITEQYRICIALINHFLRNNKENLETESLCSVHLLELIIHTENGAFLLVNSLARSFSQHKVREKKILNTIAVFFREIAKNERIPDRTKFEAMNDQITAYKREIPVFLRQSLFTNWVDSKIQKKTLWQMHQDTLEET